MDSLSDEVLITELLPRFPLDTLKNLFMTSKRFSQVCTDETLWKFKAQREYPEGIKSDEISWREFYYLISSGYSLPLYYHGDRIATIPFHPRLIPSLVKLIEPYIIQMNLTERVRIVLVDSRRTPILTIQWPEMVISTLPGSRVPEKILFFKGKRRIFQELISEHGTPPIYGMSKSNKFQLIDNRSGQSHFRSFDTWAYRDLIEILWLLKVRAPEPIQQVDLAVRGRLVEEVFLMDRVDEDQVDFYFPWLVSNTSRIELSEVILEKLREIGHLL